MQTIPAATKPKNGVRLVANCLAPKSCPSGCNCYFSDTAVGENWLKAAAKLAVAFEKHCRKVGCENRLAIGTLHG